MPFDAAVLKRYEEEELHSVSSSTSREQSLLGRIIG